MQKQFQYITDLAKKYQGYADNNELLFNALNSLETKDIKDILEGYGNPEKRFYPVIFLRTEIARRLLKGETINAETVEEIKQNIRDRKIDVFKHMPESFLNQITNYPERVRDVFNSWRSYWNVLHVFFYTSDVKATVQTYLESIAKDLIKKIGLTDHTFHFVDFQGASNFGSTMSWLALYPDMKEDHRNSFQFFFGISSSPEAGLIKGHSLNAMIENDLTKVSTYEDVIAKLNQLKTKIIKLNAETKNYFKFSPGRQAYMWDDFYQKGIIAINYKDDDQGIIIEDISKSKSLADLNLSIGLAPDSQSNTTWNVWLLKTAKIGDVVFAAKGVKTCIGIGIITGDYEYKPREDGYNHIRKVKWITNKVYQYTANSLKFNEVSNYKTLFRPDTFSPTLAWNYLLNEYIRLYPELESVFKQNNLLFTIIGPDRGTTTDLPENYWWLNANPKIWSISDSDENDLQTYTTHNERGNKRRIYKYFEEAKPGDYVIGYESSPSKQIKAIYQISKGIHLKDGEEQIEFKLIEKLEIPVHWNEIKNIRELSECEVIINNQGSLFKLTEEEYDIIVQIIDHINTPIQAPPGSRYTFYSDPDKPFISESDFIQATELLQRKKNIIIQGPPGVGKTFIARKLAYHIMGQIQNSNIEMVQFHQSYSYEDFIQGLRPTQSGNFDLRNGIFYTFCKKALSHPNRKFFFVIDEINRGNLSKIFGELMMLIEADKRSEKFAIKLTYAEDEEDRFYVPDNLFIIGTMNTADRSLAIVDYALRRRFAFISLQPDFGIKFKEFIKNKGVSESMTEQIAIKISELNSRIKSDLSLGDGFQIGHSYFCTFDKGIYNDEKDWYNEVVKFEIKPLLEEIWFDDETIVKDFVEKLSM